MLEVNKETDQLITLRLSGKLDSVDMKIGLDQLIEATREMKDGKLLYLIDDFAIPSLSAIMVEMTKLPSLFAMLTRIDKCAVVADENWIRTVAEWEGALLPGLEIKGFEEDEEKAARAWLKT